MKYIANPVAVDAFVIVVIGTPDSTGNRYVKTDDGKERIATAEMCSRLVPVPGDYWVIQADGYPYVNPREVFERKYRPYDMSTLMETDGITITKDGTVIGRSERVDEFRAFCASRGKLLGG